MSKRSDNITAGAERMPNRSLLRACGLTEEEMNKPIIGIVSAYSEIIPGHINLDKIADAAKAGVRIAGGTPVLVPAIGVCDGIAMGHIGMKYSLPSRELIADSVETLAQAHQFDALVLIPNCDKIVPGMLMAAARLNIPSIIVSGGPMLAGHYNGEEISLSKTFETVGAYKAGLIDDEKLMECECGSCPGCGSCSGMYTANSMNCLSEAIGMARDAVGSLDIPTPKGKGDVHLISLSNAKAEDLAQVINTLVERQRAAGTEDQKPDTVLSKDIKVVADKSTNSLVVTARPDEFEALSNIVAKLDVVRKQVFIEALIMEVSSEASFSFGINWAIGGNTGDAAIVGGVSLNGGAVSLSSSGANKTVSLPAGVSIGAILKDAITVGNTSYNIQSILNAVRGNSDVDVLATPQLLTLDNEEASVEVVDNIPFTKESTTRNDNDFTTQSMDYKDVGVKLKITPRISDDGSLRLEVEQEVSRVTQGLITLTNGDQLVAPTTRKRLVKTTILLQDSQTAVIGGLLDDQKTYNQSEVPGLGSIPVLGWLFKSRNKKSTQTNLFIFITPKVIRNAADSADLTREKQLVLHETSVGHDGLGLPIMSKPKLLKPVFVN